MKKFICMLLAVLSVCLLFTSCNGTDEVTTDTEAETTEAPANTEETEKNDGPKTLKIGEEDISKYKIVYEYNAGKGVIFGINRTYWNSEYDYQLVTAKRLAQMVKDTFGVELEMSADKTTEESEYEILIGNTNRAETQTTEVKSLGIDNFTVKVTGKKFIICGGAPGSLYHALDKLEAFFASETENNTYVIDTSSYLSGEYRLKHVACIGDSITAGSGSAAREYLSWAAVLGNMNWQECAVINYGKGSTTMRSDLNDSYRNFRGDPSLWNRCLTASKNEVFDVVLIMLGTNDSDRDKDWTDADDTQFKNDFRYMVDQLKVGSPDAEFVLMNCPAYYGTEGYGSAHVREIQAEIAETMKTEGYKMHFYDMHSYTSEKLGKSCYPDLLHPNDKGYNIIAQGLSEMLGLLSENKTGTYLKY